MAGGRGPSVLQKWRRKAGCERWVREWQARERDEGVWVNKWIKIYLGYKWRYGTDLGWGIWATSLLFLDREEELELWRELLLAVEPVWEVDSTDPAIGVDGDPKSLNIVGPVSPACEVRQIELDLVPSWVRKSLPSSNLMGMVQMKGLTLVVDW